MPFSVASITLPRRRRYSRSSSTSMMAARVAGVPRPVSRIASASSFSSNARPADSMAVSSVASVKRGGGRVRFFTASTSSTDCGCARANPDGSVWGSSSGSRSASSPLRPSDFSRGAFCPPPMSSTFQPTCSTWVPVLWKRSTTGGAPADVTAVMTVVTRQTWSSCHAWSRRRHTRS